MSGGNVRAQRNGNFNIRWVDQTLRLRSFQAWRYAMRSAGKSRLFI